MDGFGKAAVAGIGNGSRLAVPGYDGGGAVSQVQRSSHITNAIERHSETVSRLTECVISLRERLAPVLRHEPASPSSQSEKRAGASTPLAEFINQKSDEISSSLEVLNDIFARLEL